MKRWQFNGDVEKDVPALGQTVAPGDVVEVHDPEVSDGLEGQEYWEHIPDPERSKAAKKAAANRADDDDSQEG